MKSLILLCIHLLIVFATFAQADIPDISGWNKTSNNGTYHFLPNGNTKLDYYVMLVKNTDNDLDDWIKQQALSDINSNGWHEKKGVGVSQKGNGGYGYVTSVYDNANKEFVALYIAYAISNKLVRWAKIIYPASNFSKDEINIAVKHFVALSKNEMQNNNSTPQNKNSENTTIESIKNTGISNTSKIMGVILHRESSIGVGGMVMPIQRPYLFFKDGTFYGWLDVDPNSINTASHNSNIQKWGTWKMNGKVVTIRWESDGKSSDWTSAWWMRAVPASKSDKLKGSFESISGGGNTISGGGNYTMSSKFITFSSDGRFTFESVGGGGYSGNEGSNSAWSSHNTAGTYELDGYSIVFKYNNGNIVRNAFYFYDDDKDMFGINTSIYTKDNSN